MNTTAQRAIAAVVVGSAGVASADFVTPDSYGWSRGAENSFYAEWDFFESPFGGNIPSEGMFPSSLPAGWTMPDVVETSGSSFITGGGNIYSFSAITEFEVTVPNYDLGGKQFGTTVLVQMRTLGAELDYESIRIGSVSPVETIELDRTAVGGGLGGEMVDVLFRFDLNGNAADYLIEFESATSSMSLDRLAIDTFSTSRLSSANASGLFRSSDAGPVPAPGAACLLAAGGLAVCRRRRS
ncbi:MAG: hypothetical protein AAFS11_00280 [Planctomycetota bacterium]